MIRDFLAIHSKVNLFSRPHLFGKTLNVSMFADFLDIQMDSHYFERLNIGQYPSVIQMYRNQFPVIFVTLKNVERRDFESAKNRFKTTIRNMASKYRFLFNSDKLSKNDKSRLLQICNVDSSTHDTSIMSDAALNNSLFTLSYLLSKHYGRFVVLIIDAFDHPLEQAYELGYYDAMIKLIRDVMNVSLKTNEYLNYAVLSGCLPIISDSLFTGLNNFICYSNMSFQFDKYFGFTEAEVQDMLAYYDLGYKYDTFKERYYGYRFGKTSVFCPWDVINYCNDLLIDRDIQPKAYWLNASNNYVLDNYVSRQTNANSIAKLKLLISGYPIVQKIDENLNYQELFSNEDNFWSLLYMTGFLTLASTNACSVMNLTIPNAEIRDYFIRNFPLCNQGDDTLDNR